MSHKASVEGFKVMARLIKTMNSLSIITQENLETYFQAQSRFARHVNTAILKTLLSTLSDKRFLKPVIDQKNGKSKKVLGFTQSSKMIF